MKKLHKSVLLIPLSSIFLSGCMNKTIQKTIAVTTNISSNEELQDRDYFGVSHQTHISKKCFNYSISESELNEMLSKGVKVTTVADQRWNRKISYKGMNQNYYDEWGVWDAEGTCLGKKYVLEGKEKLINQYASRIDNFQNQEFKNLNAQTKNIDSRPEMDVFRDQYKYDLNVQKDSQGRTVNILTRGKFTKFIILGKNGKVDFEGSLFDYSDVRLAPKGLTWKKIDGKYELKVTEKFRDGNQNVVSTSIFLYDLLAE